MSIITRSGKGSRLTAAELDNNFLTLSGSIVRTNKTRYVDSVYGNNSTAVVNDPSKPYQTIIAAVSASATDDLVIVYPGSYLAGGISGSILKDRVHMYCHPGVTITGVGNNERPIFNADPTNTGYPVTGLTVIAGHAVVNGTGFFRNNNQSGSQIHIELDKVDGITNQAVFTLGNFGVVKLNIRDGFVTADRCLRLDGDGVFEINARYLQQTLVNQFAWPVFTAATFSGSLKLKADYITRTITGGSPSTLDLYGNNAKIFIELDELNSLNTSTNWPVVTLYKNVNLHMKIRRASTLSQHLIGLWNAESYTGKAYIEVDNYIGSGSGYFLVTPPGSNCPGTIIINNTDATNVGAGCVYVDNTTKVVLRNSTFTNTQTGSGVPVVKTNTNSVLSLMGTTLVGSFSHSLNNLGSADNVLSEGSKANLPVSGSITGNLYVNSLYTI